MNISFGDNVRILSSPETDKIGLSGKTGNVYGETTPSITDVEVIGALKNDYALNVCVDDDGSTYWFSPDLLEFIDHAPGTTHEVAGIKSIRNEDGTWTTYKAETGDRVEPQANEAAEKKWWQFWR